MTPSKELRISESTRRFIDILRKYNGLYPDAFSALELTFSESDCLESSIRASMPNTRHWKAA